MAGTDNEVRMMMSVYPGAMTGFAALNSGLVSINNVFGSMTRSVDAQFGLINTAIVTTGVVAAQFAADCMGAFGQFEQGMKIVQMVSGQTTEDIQYLKQQANDLSVSFRTDIDQITEGLQTLGRAGLNSASEQVEVLENGLSTAKLEGRDLNGVLEELIQNTALLGGDLKSSNFGEQSQYVNDMLVATSMTAPITTHDVSETLKYSGGIAAAAGANIETESGKRILEDYLGSIAAFAQKGVTGSIAGTALRAFFNKPATQDSSVTEALSSIHLTPEALWEDDEETMKPVSEQIGIIQKQMDKLDVSTMDRLQIWSKIVGGKMGQQMMKLDSSDIKELTKDIRAADDATSLAQGSMRTYEANVKAIGEAGERFKRNIGEDLVGIANPILSVIAKIAEFLNNDFLSFPFTAGILALITAAARRIKGIFSSIKAEISELLSAYRAGVNYFTQKGGVVRRGDNPLDDEKKAEFYEKHGIGKSYQGKKSSDKQLDDAKLNAAKSLNEYGKIYRKGIMDSGPLTLKDFQKAGISDLHTAMAGHFGSLTKDSLDKGISDGKLLQAGFRYNLFNENELKSLTSAFKGGMSARPMANLIDLESLYSRLLKNEGAVQALGLTLEEESVVTKDAQIADQQRISAINDLIADQKILVQQTKDAQISDQQRISSINDLIADQKILVEQTEATGPRIVTEVETTTTQVVADVEKCAAEIKATFLNLSQSLGSFRLGFKSGSSSTPSSPSGSSSYIPRGYPLLPSDINNMMGRPYVPFAGMRQIKRDLNAKKLEELDTAMRAEAFQRALNNPYIPEKTGRTKTDARIDAALRGNRLQKDFKEYNEAQAAHFSNLLTRHVDKAVANYQGGAGVGGISGRLPSEEAVEASIKAHNQVYTSRGSLSSEPSGMNRVGGVVNRKDIEDIRSGVKQIVHHSQSLTRHSNFESSGMGKFGLGKSGVKDIQENTEKIVNSTMGRVNDAVVNAASTGLRRVGVVTRDDIAKIREDANKQFYQNQENMKKNSLNQQEHIAKVSAVANTNSLTNSGLSLEEKIAFRLSKLHQVQESGKVDRMIKEGQYKSYGVSGIPTSYYTMSMEDRNKAAMALHDYENSFKNRVKSFGSNTILGSGLVTNFRDRINRDRSGSFISFGKEVQKDSKGMVTGIRSATKGLSGMGNKLLNLTDLIGGPVMLAFMIIPKIFEYLQGLYESYSNDVKRLSENVETAYSDMNNALSGLKSTYKDANPDATAEDVENYMLDVYSQRYDDFWNQKWQDKATIKNDKELKQYEYDEEADNGSYKEVEEEKTDEERNDEAIRENTGALYTATAQLQTSMQSLVTKMGDERWGIDGRVSQLSDLLGAAEDNMGTWGQGKSSVEEGGLLLTASQKDENYKGYTEMAGLMLEDFHDAQGNLSRGLHTMFGRESNDILSGMSDKGKVTLQRLANFSAGNEWAKGQSRLTRNENLKMQQSMKLDKKSWQAAAKEMAKVDMKKRSGKQVTARDTKRLEGYIKKLATDTGLDEVKIKQGLQLQQLQDMYTVAQQSMVPLAAQQAQIAAQHLVVGEGTKSGALGASSGSNDTAAIAAVIASYVAVVAQAKAGEAYFEAQRQAGDPDALAAKDANEYLSKGYGKNVSLDNLLGSVPVLGGLYSAGKQLGFQDAVLGKDTVANLQKPFLKLQAEHPERFYGQMLVLETMGEKSRNPQWTDEQAEYNARKKLDSYFDSSGNPLFNQDVISRAIRENYSGAITPGLIQEYMGSDIGEPDKDGEGSGGGGSGGGGSGGSGDNDKTGTRKERVDLVLCNKKEIPKLNVNLFKKPPSFTVLNKNFKLRDVKINTEDKPKAIMSSIKNAFIDVQKRSDPKIIQDEEGVYDPEGATDGNALPSGSAKTKTDSQR